MTDKTGHERPADDPFRDGIRTVAGILGALKDAIEETFDDLRERGDLSPDRARDAARETVRKAQASFDEMRERVDFVSRREFEALRSEVDALRARLDARDGADPAAGSTADAPPPAAGDGVA